MVVKVGMLYCDAEVLRGGNEQLLDSIEEGVIILEEESLDILYYNAAALG